MIRFLRIMAAVVLCATLGLYPWSPQPHLVQKLEWLFNSSVEMSLMHFGDMFMHLAPWMWLLFELGEVYTPGHQGPPPPSR